MQIQLRDKNMTLGNFGIEIEMYNVDKARLVNQLNQAGIAASVEYYNHNLRNHWKIVSDASIVDGRGRRIASGAELVSPVLNGADGLAQIETVCRVLEAHGAKVRMSCGLHVHHEAVGFDSAALKKVVKVYRRVEKHVDAFMPKSRRDSRCFYAKSIINVDEELLIPGGSSARRYYKVNLQSFLRHGTIEFRHHSGTVEAQKIINWVLFTALVVDKARGRIASDKALKRWVDVKWFLGVTTDRIDDIMKDMVRFYTDRRKHFAE